LRQSPPDDAGLQHAIRANIAACRRRTVDLKSVLDSFVPAWAVAFSPDGKTVLMGSGDGTARLWSVADGTPLGQPWKHGQVRICAVAFSPDGKIVVTRSGDGTARLWSVADGTPLGQPLKHRGSVEAVAFSPDGKTVLMGSGDGTARLWSVADGTPLG